MATTNKSAYLHKTVYHKCFSESMGFRNRNGSFGIKRCRRSDNKLNYTEYSTEIFRVTFFGENPSRTRTQRQKIQ